jgi:hypothetical protein
MKLPVRDFADIVAALKGVSDGISASENRKAARMHVCAKVDLHLVVDARPARTYSALTRDISLTGVGLLQSVALPPEQEVIISLPRAGGPLFVHALAKHCRVLADGLLTAGLEFTKLADAALSTVLIQQGKDRRARIQQSVIG